MVWILIIFVIVVLYVFLRFIMDFIKQRNDIESKGGIKTIYKTLIAGIMEYPSARITQDKRDFITIGGIFTDPLFHRECGVWSVIIRPTFETLNVKYQAHTDLGDGKISKKIWNFPISMNQEEMLKVIKKKADEWYVYCIVK